MSQQPYESPIEETLAYHLAKYVAATMTPQEELGTRWGVFRPDFVLDMSGFRVGIECDGRHFHDSYRDLWRDMVLLGDGHLDVMYRFPGTAIVNATCDTLFIMSRLDPKLFHERGLLSLESLSSDWARLGDWREAADDAESEGTFFRWETFREDAEIHEGEPALRGGGCVRRTRASRGAARPPWDWRYYEYAIEAGSRPLDEVIDMWRRRGGR